MVGVKIEGQKNLIWWWTAWKYISYPQYRRAFACIWWKECRLTGEVINHNMDSLYFRCLGFRLLDVGSLSDTVYSQVLFYPPLVQLAINMVYAHVLGTPPHIILCCTYKCLTAHHFVTWFSHKYRQDCHYRMCTSMALNTLFTEQFIIIIGQLTSETHSNNHMSTAGDRICKTVSMSLPFLRMSGTRFVERREN